MKSCLIIDDEADKASILVKRLENLFENIPVAKTFKTGLEMAKKFHYEFILLDINLPDANGMMSAEVLKKACPDSMIVLTTAYKRTADASKLITNKVILTVLDTLDEMAYLPDLIEYKRNYNEMRQYAN